MFPRVRLHPIEFPVYYKIKDIGVVIAFKDAKKCLVITNNEDGMSISEDPTAAWIDHAMCIGHKCSKLDFAEALLMATTTIERHYKPEPQETVMVTTYEAVRIAR